MIPERGNARMMSRGMALSAGETPAFPGKTRSVPTICRGASPGALFPGSMSTIRCFVGALPWRARPRVLGTIWTARSNADTPGEPPAFPGKTRSVPTICRGASPGAPMDRTFSCRGAQSERPLTRFRNNMKNTMLSVWVCTLIVSLLFLQSARCATTTDERPVNFVFLIDVSGSMLYKSEMVKAKDGSQVTLFEALREALRQIASDERLLGKSSKLSVITFGTVVNEKSNWPTSVQTVEDRQKLLNLIDSTSELQADKHGDTYMGGALQSAYSKAKELQSASEPCATTFIIMLTDGWDEPPKNAQYRVKDEANIFLAKEREVKNKLGFDPWQVKVIGLQRLPDRKVGTTTAKELATMLGGQFIDVSAEQNGTVSERIFLALKQAVEEQKGKIIFPSDFRLVDFGKVNNEGTATCKIPVRLDSCYPEDVTGVREEVARARSKQAVVGRPLPFGALTFALAEPSYTLNPHPPSSQDANSSDHTDEVTVKATAHNSCPAGNFRGILCLISTAKVDRSLPYAVAVPARIVAEPEEIQVEAKKTGFLSAQGVQIPLKFALKEAPGSHAHANLRVAIRPEAAAMNNCRPNELVTLAAPAINSGRTLTCPWDTESHSSMDFIMPLEIADNQLPGRYSGKLTLELDGLNEVVAPTSVPFTLVIKPSPWEEVAPIAVPILATCFLTVGFAIFLWLTTLRRESS
jgi:uncharacterized protein YegL